MCFGLSLSCDFQINMGHTFIRAGATPLHTSLAAMRATTASAQGRRSSATYTCKDDVGCVLEVSPNEMLQLLLLATDSEPTLAWKMAKNVAVSIIAQAQRKGAGRMGQKTNILGREAGSSRNADARDAG